MKFNLPKCKISDKKGGFLKYDFSFSGLKTAVLRLVERINLMGRPFQFQILLQVLRE